MAMLPLDHEWMLHNAQPLPSSRSATDKFVQPSGMDPAVFQAVSFDTTVCFFDIVSLLKPVLKLHCSIYDPEPLDQLPKHVLKFLNSCLGTEEETLHRLWTMFRAAVWKVAYDAKLTQRLGNKYIGLFLQHGPANDISEDHRYALAYLGIN
ncbi:hypothetical protein H1R20_g9036, partial [Candolleomyces eurysporus]